MSKSPNGQKQNKSPFGSCSIREKQRRLDICYIMKNKDAIIEKYGIKLDDGMPVVSDLNRIADGENVSYEAVLNALVYKKNPNMPARIKKLVQDKRVKAEDINNLNETGEKGKTGGFADTDTISGNGAVAIIQKEGQSLPAVCNTPDKTSIKTQGTAKQEKDYIYCLIDTNVFINEREGKCPDYIILNKADLKKIRFAITGQISGELEKFNYNLNGNEIDIINVEDMYLNSFFSGKSDKSLIIAAIDPENDIDCVISNDRHVSGYIADSFIFMFSDGKSKTKTYNSGEFYEKYSGLFGEIGLTDKAKIFYRTTKTKIGRFIKSL